MIKITLLLLVLGQAELPDDEYLKLPAMPAAMRGEPKTIGQMRIGDVYSVPAHALIVDISAKCWLDPECKLDEKSDHMITVKRFKEVKFIGNPYLIKRPKKTIIGYSVHISKIKLQGWRWKKTPVERGGGFNGQTYHIPVLGLTIGD